MSSPPALFSTAAKYLPISMFHSKSQIQSLDELEESDEESEEEELLLRIVLALPCALCCRPRSAPHRVRLPATSPLQ
eukprot:12865072-Heterocapsa_arctica.AAC.1